MSVIQNWRTTVRWFALRRLIRSRFPEVVQISTSDLAQILDSPRGQPVLLVDTREKREFEVSHLPEAVWCDPSASMEDLTQLVAGDRPIVTYCSVGYRSSAIARRLVQAGRKDVRNLEGSIFKWANEGRTVVRDGRPVGEVHPYDGTWGVLLRRDLHARSRTG